MKFVKEVNLWESGLLDIQPFWRYLCTVGEQISSVR
jgi:hypothetical protein